MRNEIEAYLNGELQGEQFERFEAEIAKDPALRTEVEKMRPLLDDLRRARIAQQVQRAERQRFARRRARRVTIVACTGLFFLGVFFWMLSRKNPGEENSQKPETELPKNDPQPEIRNSKFEIQHPEKPVAENKPNPKSQIRNPKSQIPNPARLALSFYKPPASLNNFRGADSDVLLDSAKTLFSENEYGKALALLDSAGTKNTSPEIRHLRAHCHLAAGDFSPAAEAFDQILADPEMTDYKEMAQWYGLLARVGEGKKSEKTAQQMLQTILENPDHLYLVRAERLAAALKGSN